MINRPQVVANLALYLNTLGYPRVYSDADVQTFLLAAGASRVTRIVKVGRLYPSLASTWVNQDGSTQAIPQPLTKTLLPETAAPGMGPRNMIWYVEPAAISLLIDRT